MQWRNWAGDERCRPAAFARPGSEEELVAALAEAQRRELRVRVVGAGHSFSDIVCSEGMLISLQRMNRVLDVDRASGLVRMQGGITIAALSAELARHGLAMENLGDIDIQSIAGAICTATHGTGARLRNISSQVHALTLVLADGSTLLCASESSRSPAGSTLRCVPESSRSPAGSTLRCVPDSPRAPDGPGQPPGHAERSNVTGSDLFRAAQVSLGALGVISEVTLRCVPAFTLRGLDAPAPLHETLARFEELALANDHFELFVFPHADVALTRTNNRTDEPPRPRGRLAAYANDVLLTNHAFGLFCRLGRRMPSRIPQINRLVTRLAGSSHRIDRSDRVFASPRLVRFTEMEYAVPRAATAEAVRRVLEAIERHGFAVPFPVEARSVAGDDAMLSTAAGRDSGYVAVHMFEGMRWRPYFEAVEAIMNELDGRPHWGKRHFQTAQTLRARYPRWDDFQAVRTRLDPGGRFANAWTDRVLGPVGG